MKKAVLKELPIEFLQRGKYQPRQHFSSESLEELAASIQSQGLIEPIVVRPLKEDKYEIIAGERRWRAASLCGIAEIPCLINHYNDEQAAAVSLIENIQRENLNPIEEAMGYKQLIDEFFFYQDEVAKMVGKSRTYVTNALRVLELDKRVQQLIIDKQLSIGHAKILVGLDASMQVALSNKVIQQQWSVRKLETEVKRSKMTVSHDNPKKDKDITRLESLIAESCGAKAEIEQGDNNGGWLKIQFFDNDTLAGLLDKMGVKYD